MAIELLSIDKAILQALEIDPILQGLFGFYGYGDSRNNIRFSASATNINAAIFADVAPLDTPEPFLSFAMENNVDVNAMGGFRAFQDAIYSVVVRRSAAGYGSIKPFADAIDNIMEGLGFTNDSGAGTVVYRFVRQSTIRMSNPDDNNVTWYTLGGVYATMVSTIG